MTEGPFDAVAPLLAERQELAAQRQAALEGLKGPADLDPDEAYRVWLGLVREIHATFAAKDEALLAQIRRTQAAADARRYGPR